MIAPNLSISIPLYLYIYTYLKNTDRSLHRRLSNFPKNLCAPQNCMYIRPTKPTGSLPATNWTKTPRGNPSPMGSLRESGNNSESDEKKIAPPKHYCTWKMRPDRAPIGQGIEATAVPSVSQARPRLS